jgi:multidrug efflux pump subunit AcrB
LAGLGPIIALAVFGILAVLVIEFGRFRETVVAGVIPLGLFGGLMALFLTGNSPQLHWRSSGSSR